MFAKGAPAERGGQAACAVKSLCKMRSCEPNPIQLWFVDDFR